MFEKETLLTTFKELLGIEGIKPFECVGTNEEVVLGMKKSYDLRKDTYHEPLPAILQMFAQEVLPRMHEDDFLHLEKKLMNIYAEGTMPEIFRTSLSV